jgi:hypothetical protein
MAEESLGRAVLELVADLNPLKGGLAEAKGGGPSDPRRPPPGLACWAMDEPMRGEMRKNDAGDPEVWICLDEVLDWLAELPGKTDHPAAGQSALEIRQMLIDFVGNAELRTAES